MTLYPEYVLTVLMVSVFIVASWMLRACEMYHDEYHENFFNSMWLIAITFLSVGYGDIVPNSYCGRGIAVLTGIFGAGCTALVVAVLARKLELSRAEKYVHNFVIDVELDKRFKHAAANILKAGWFVYKNKKLGKTRLVRRYQKKLLKAIHSIRDVKQEQRRLADNSITMVEMFKSQTSLLDDIREIERQQSGMEAKVTNMETKLDDMNGKLDTICNVLSSGKRWPADRCHSAQLLLWRTGGGKNTTWSSFITRSHNTHGGRWNLINSKPIGLTMWTVCDVFLLN